MYSIGSDAFLAAVEVVCATAVPVYVMREVTARKNDATLTVMRAFYRKCASTTVGLARALLEASGGGARVRKRKRLPSAGTPAATSHGGDSTFLRSAELLGRMIGSLQRRLGAAAARLSSVGPLDGSKRSPSKRKQNRTRAKKSTASREPRSASGRSAKGSRPK